MIHNDKLFEATLATVVPRAFGQSVGCSPPLFLPQSHHRLLWSHVPCLCGISLPFKLRVSGARLLAKHAGLQEQAVHGRLGESDKHS